MRTATGWRHKLQFQVTLRRKLRQVCVRVRVCEEHHNCLSANILFTLAIRGNAQTFIAAKSTCVALCFGETVEVQKGKVVPVHAMKTYGGEEV